jgi:hypothetical protein
MGWPTLHWRRLKPMVNWLTLTLTAQPNVALPVPGLHRRPRVTFHYPPSHWKLGQARLGASQS